MRYPTETEVKAFIEGCEDMEVSVSAPQGLLWGKVSEIGEDTFVIDGTEIEYADVYRYSE